VRRSIKNIFSKSLNFNADDDATKEQAGIVVNN
jgi:hypothetical protein